MVNAFAANLEQFRYIERIPSETAAILLHMSSPNAGDIHNHLRYGRRNRLLLRDLQSMSPGDVLDWPSDGDTSDQDIMDITKNPKPVNEDIMDITKNPKPVDEDTYFKNLALAVCPNGSEILLDNSTTLDENKYMNIHRVSVGPDGIALQERLMVKANQVAIDGQCYFAFEGKDYKIELESGDKWELKEGTE